MAVVLILSWCQAAAGQTAQAQAPETSRAARLEAQRRARAMPGLPPPDRSFLESKLYWYDGQYVLTRLLNGWKGVHYSGGDFPTGAGLKFGVAFTDVAVGSIHEDEATPNRVDVDAVAAYTSRGYVQATGAVTVRNVGGAPIHLAARGGYWEFPQEDFFGLGPDSQEADRTSYLLDTLEIGATATWEPAPWVRGGGGIARLSPRVGRGTDERFPDTRGRFDPADLPGSLEQPDFRRASAWVAVDWEDNPALPRAGGLARVEITDYHDLDLGRHDFRLLEASIDQYVPLGGPSRVLALHAATVVSDTDAGQQVPFFYQPTLGGRKRLRGFREFRFRDQNSVSLTAEYRWEAWWALDVALFADAGKVTFDRRDLDLSDLEATYGVGFRIHSNSAYSFRVDLGVSREGFIPFFTGSYVF